MSQMTLTRTTIRDASSSMPARRRPVCARVAISSQPAQLRTPPPPHATAQVPGRRSHWGARWPGGPHAFRGAFISVFSSSPAACGRSLICLDRRAFQNGAQQQEGSQRKDENSRDHYGCDSGSCRFEDRPYKSESSPDDEERQPEKHRPKGFGGSSPAMRHDGCTLNSVLGAREARRGGSLALVSHFGLPTRYLRLPLSVARTAVRKPKRHLRGPAQ